MDKLFGFMYFLLAVATSMIGIEIHDSVFWAIMDFIFMPFAWLKWLIFHEVNLTIIQGAFSFFLQ